MANNRKILGSFAALSIMATLHLFFISGIPTPDSTETFRVRRDALPVENPSLALVDFFRSIVMENFTLNYPIDQDSKPPIYYLEDCANDNLYNRSESLTPNDQGQVEGHGKIIYDRKALCRRFHQVHSIEGFFVKGQPHGPAIITYRDRTLSKANFVNGVLEGLFVNYWCKFGSCEQFDLESWRKSKHLKEIIVYRNGRPSGTRFRFRAGGGFVVGDNDLTGNMVAYVYPDMETMIVGKFEKGELIAGKEALLTGLETTENGLIRPRFEVHGQNEFHKSVSNQTWIGDDPLVRDPLECKYLYVANSTQQGAGRGVFLKKKGRQGQVVGFYNGVRMSDVESKLKVEDRKSPYRMDNDWATPSEILNIPAQYRDLESYNATIGHLLNHSPQPNAWYGMIDHPRFGKIRSIILLQEVEPGQELFADYGYLKSYMQSENMIRTIYKASKWFMNENEQDFHQDLKFHIKYLKNKVNDIKPYMSMIKAMTNLL